MSMLNVASCQAVDAVLTRCATFLTFKAKSDASNLAVIRATLGSISDLTKNVAIRDLRSNLTCTVSIGSDFWDRLTHAQRPKELRPLPVIKGRVHATVSTPADLLFHIRSDRRDLCFELERQVMDRFGNSVQLTDSTVGFRYFDARDLLGFVDGTANPVGQATMRSAIVTSETDEAAAGGSYVVVQKYLHDLAGWKKLKVEEQESIIGRTKVENMELDDAAEGKQAAHKTLASITDGNGNEVDIVRDNMPFGSPASDEFGTYFIGYSSKLWVIEKMLERMFVGSPPGMHDRILDYSTPVTGCTFFAPSADMLDSLADVED
ncbi:hypothetical protein SNK03_005434 [Fusarium graminearum]|uniref:Chromosome 2, complete genome n=2 Tax=Gibberella zeae TaxID=5518 RepID=I1RGL1_GIBZE|nr:hypothetical protein FGSG_02882 [Fusarium graminearum PH-1]PCD34557.1 hypothetical protein FGRA07_08875 [Fusarium graminearum]ESU10424.1 hypothetical protein FGSG_02882 [Fusarium graminearum PH-1]CAF3490917.1 unnamed protein product [Fusarium graminearum]CAG1960210.1 unnamed protein product [Fusarium graminearum]CAG1978365.1 unnamed protein product [Fusarium graminearum]|eukprot:XP_011322923.1 hypothetical protein FGSG_02882 [Fusarium graminearum PH-1]